MVGHQISGDKVDSATGDFSSTLSVDMVWEKEVGDATVTIYLMHAEGFVPSNDPGINADFEGQDVVGDNASDAGFSTTRIAEAKIEYPFSEELTLTIGKISPQGYFDTNNVANDQTRQFLGAPMVNNTAIAFPSPDGPATYAYPSGVIGSYALSDTMTISGGFFEDAYDVATETGSTGTFKNNFLIGELDVAMELLDGETNIRAIYWSSEQYDTTGVAVSADQTYGEDMIFFVRFGTNTLPSTAENGATLSEMSGGLQMPVGDYTLGLGYAITNPNKTGGDIDVQTWMEGYIQMELTEGILFALNYQSITNPGFDKTQGTFTAIGGRLQVDF